MQITQIFQSKKSKSAVAFAARQAQIQQVRAASIRSAS